jgi:hypothetical protein
MIRIRKFLLASVVLTMANSARADNIDMKLYSEAAPIVQQIQKNGYKTVGALHFRCQKGDGPESFTLGPICSSMTTRLERALVLQDPVDQPFMLVKDVTGTAMAKKVSGWQNHAADRAKLFTLTYPSAWGNAPAKPDALLTGVVHLSKDMMITTVVVEAYSAKAPDKKIKLHEFSVGTDRNILEQFGQSYEVASRSVRGKRSAERDQLAVRDAHRRDAGDTEGGTASPSNVAGLEIRILYDNQLQTIQADPNSSGEWRVAPPQQNMKVKFEVVNTGRRAQRLGAALSLNGRGFWRQETGDVTQNQIWLFDAGKAPTEFAGFYMDEAGKNLIPFKVLSEEESQAREAEFGDKVGLLQMDVFEPQADNAEEELKISLARSVVRPGKPAQISTLEDAKRAVLTSDRSLFRTARSSPALRGLIVGTEEGTIPGGDLAIQTMPNPVKIASITIRYYDPKKSGDSSQISN